VGSGAGGASGSGTGGTGGSVAGGGGVVWSGAGGQSGEGPSEHGGETGDAASGGAGGAEHDGGEGGGGNECEGAECDCLKVVIDGDDAAASMSGGTSPFRSLQAAIDHAASRADGPQNVCVASAPSCIDTQSVFAGPVVMRNGVSVYGGYESQSWTRCDSRSTELALDTATGVRFGPDVQRRTVFDGFTIHPLPALTTVGITIDGATGVSVSAVLVMTNLDVTRTFCGVDILEGSAVVLRDFRVRASSAGWAGTLFDTVGLRARGASVSVRDAGFDIAAAEQGTARGIWLEEMGDVRLSNVSVSAYVGAELMRPIGGVATGVDVAGATNVEVQGSITAVAGDRGTVKGVYVRDATNVQFEGRVSVRAGAAGDASGVTVQRNAAARIKASVTASTSNGSASGIGCGTNCTITQTSVVLSNAVVNFNGSPFSMSSGGIGCGAGCSLTESAVQGPRPETCYTNCTSSTTGVRVSGGGGFISGNRIEAGCGLAATGLYVMGSARVENNYVTVGCGGNPKLQYAFGAVLAGDVDLHSNSISSNGRQPTGVGCATVGACVANGSHASIRNNTFGAGECTQRYHFAELCPYGFHTSGLPPANPLVFEHNNFVGDSTPRYFDNDSWSTLLSLEEINTMPDVISSGNLFGGIGIDAGTPAGAPLVDIDGRSRDTSPDIGPYDTLSQ
jgi:hypothetical protein